ncbi:MAG: BspA family leucine-rich repeat surface protein, partial [Clostridia bacterium]|nr:BspA family leucine-rich repeat surface protein [Clostridia bacterium]
MYVDGNYSVIEGFDFIENITNNNHGVVFLSVASDNSVIQDCNCFKNYGCSFYLNSEPFDQATSVKIDNCTFYDNGDSYYDIREGAYTNITNCTFVCDDSDCELKKHILVYSDYDTAKGGICVKSANYKLEKSDDGKYHVQNSADWLKFNLAVFGGNTFYGETVELDGNISAYDRIGVWANDNSAKPFKGTFNGNGNKITLCLGDDKDGNAVANNALFSFTVGATVKNLSVDGYIKGKDGVGAVVAHAESTTLINCENHALINGSGNYAGGLVGWAKDSNIYNSANYGTVNAGNEVGGIIGRINGSGNIFNCYNEIAVTATGSDKGDFIGKNGGTATAVECFTKDVGNVYKELNINICVYNFGEGVDKSEWRFWKNSEGKIEGDKVNYSDYDKVNRTTNENSVPSDIKVYFGGDMETGWYLVRRDITVSNRINVSGEVHLIVLSGATLNAQKGIEVAENNSLSVYTTIEDSKVGTVNANGAYLSAGIGSGDGENGGNVYIYGGTVNANGGIQGAGIGGGGASGNGGNVYIYGGTVNANGGEYGAGIGGGIHADGGNFYIYGGTVNATGSITNGYQRAGISGTVSLCCCDVEMTSDGQTITEYKGERQVSITATFTEHRLFKTHEETLATYNDKGEVASYGHKEYYECECGLLFAKYGSGVLSNEITDLDAWAQADGRVGAHEHKYTIVYDWDGDSCTATATCNKDNLHVVVETVTADIVTDTEICNEKAKGHYKAVFDNSIFSVQETKPNSVEYGEPLTHNFNEDDLAKTCSRCKIKIFKNDVEKIVYTPWGEKEEEQGSLPTTSGNYYLAHDIYLSDTWTVPTGTFNLCLNGKTVMMQEDSNVILVPNGVTLNIYDYDESEKDVFGVKLYSGQIFSHHKNKRGITVKGTLNMYNGAVFGARTGVYVLDGTFNMYGGCVTASNFESEETNVYGGGVLVDGGTFTMDGGKIYGNRLRANGQGKDIFSFGAGVCVDNGGSFTMNGGKIFGNESHYGSGIYVKNGAFTMTDGEIHDNGGEGSIYGGGIYIAENCTAELTGGRIYNNTVHNLEAGAGIYSKGALSLGGTVKIENNRHDYDKGGISNLYFDNSGDSNKIIELISPENGMHVGISMKNNTSFTDIIDQGVELYFFADNDNEYVEYNGKICVREMNGFNNIYKINTESGEHGIVYASVQAVAEEFVDGTTVYITVVPEDGYGIKSLTYNGTDIAKAKSFAMIFEDVTVTAEFDKISFKAVFDENSKVLTFYYDAIDYSKAGVKVYKDLSLDAGILDWKYHEIRGEVKAVVFDKSIQDLKGLTSTAFMLAGMINADNITGAEYLDVSNVVSMFFMFERFGSNSTTLNTVPNVSEWDTSKVTDMSCMFENFGQSSSTLNAVPNVSEWDTALVKNMRAMFSRYGFSSTELTAVPNVSNWKIVSVSNIE